jgi:hypothetical protein
MVFLPYEVSSCAAELGFGCFEPAGSWCAYHATADYNVGSMIYANEPFLDDSNVSTYPADVTATQCVDLERGVQSPNGDAFADAEINLVSHESNEAITDAFGAWTDGAGYEEADNCQWVFGPPLGSTDVGSPGSTMYNQVVGTGRYYTQDEFSNEDYFAGLGDFTDDGATQVIGCRQRADPPTPAFTPPAGTEIDVPIAFGGSASDPHETDSADSFSWSFGDGSSAGGADVSHAFATVGVYPVTLTATDPDGWTGTISHDVSVVASTAATLIAQHLSFDCDLRSADTGRYVTAELDDTGNLHGVLRARSSAVGPWEQFRCVAIGANQWAIESRSNNKYVASELHDASPLYASLRARSSGIGAWETMTITPVTSCASCFALESSANGHYVSAELRYSGSRYGLLRARSRAVGPYETFVITTDST